MDIYLFFTFKIKVGGSDGAAKIAEKLRKRGVTKLDFVFDEGNPILENLFPGINKAIAGQVAFEFCI